MEEQRKAAEPNGPSAEPRQRSAATRPKVRPPLSDAEKTALRTLTVEVVLEFRKAYLWAFKSSVSRDHWDHLQSRFRRALRTATAPEEWLTTYARGLHLPSLGSSGSQVLNDLVNYVAEHDCVAGWHDLMDREHAYIMATARLCADKQREERKAAEGAV